MVENADSDYPSRLYESGRDSFVFIAWSWISAGVVVNQQHSRGRLFYRGTEDFARMNQGGGQCPFRDADQFQNTVLAVQENGPEAFLLEVLELHLKVIKDLPAAAE